MHAGIQRDRGAALPVPVRAGGSSGAPAKGNALDLEAALEVDEGVWAVIEIAANKAL